MHHGDKRSPDVEVFGPSFDPSNDEQVPSVDVLLVLAFILFAKKLVISGVCDARVKIPFLLRKPAPLWVLLERFTISTSSTIDCFLGVGVPFSNKSERVK
jgi:hypothetical protein